MSMPCKKQTIGCTQQKTLQLFQAWVRVKSLDNSNLCDNSNIQKVQQFHPRNSIASFDIIFYFPRPKIQPIRSLGASFTGSSFLRSCWSLRLCRLPFCQTQAQCLRCFINRGVVGAPLIEMRVVFAFDGWRCGPWFTCKQHVDNMLHLYTIHTLCGSCYVWV